MSIFTTILDKLGLHKPAKPAAPAETPKPFTTPPTSNYAPPKPPLTPYTPVSGPQMAPPPPPSSYTPGPNVPPVAPAAVPMVDVVSHLDNLAKANPMKLNWRTSINDLMALLGLPHTPDDIKELAVELGCPEKEMSDSYSRNVWTHKTLLQKIAENGGNIPPKLLH